MSDTQTKSAPTAAAAFYREHNAEFNQAAAIRIINQMRTCGVGLHLQYRSGKPSWSLSNGKTVPAEVAEIITQHALVKPADGALFDGMPGQLWEYVQ
jgi:hypothetical protein